MSRLADSSTGDDHPEAAAKHLDDAEALLETDRFDGAAYHAGYVIECAIKSMILLESGPPLAKALWHHKLRVLSNEALRLAAGPGARSAPYAPGIDPTHPVNDPHHGWSEKLRYKARGHIAAESARDWFAEAERVYQTIIVRMRLDGVL